MALSAQERKQIIEQDAYFLLMPLEISARPFSIAAHARKLVRLLRDSSQASPCAAAINHLVQLYERTVPPRGDIACKKGCGYCCSQPVTLTAPEAFFVASQLRDRDDTRKAIAETAARIAALAPDRVWKDWPRCPLLQDEACSVYAARPLGCHAFISLNLNACITAFVGRDQPPQIPMPLDNTNILQSCRLLLYAVLRLVGAPTKSYEMNRAVTKILGTENAEARWLAGEDILAGLEEDQPIPPQIESEIAAFAAYVAPTL